MKKVLIGFTNINHLNKIRQGKIAKRKIFLLKKRLSNKNHTCYNTYKSDYIIYKITGLH
jgi:hypothetical protein